MAMLNNQMVFGDLNPPCLETFRHDVNKRQQASTWNLTKRSLSVMQCKRIIHMMRLGFPQFAIVTRYGSTLNWLAGIFGNLCTYKRGNQQLTTKVHFVLCRSSDWWRDSEEVRVIVKSNATMKAVKEVRNHACQSFLRIFCLGFGWFEHPVLIAAAGLDQASWKARAFADVPPCAACWRERCILGL